jgi:hypothetical protein
MAKDKRKPAAPTPKSRSKGNVRQGKRKSGQDAKNFQRAAGQEDASKDNSSVTSQVEMQVDSKSDDSKSGKRKGLSLSDAEVAHLNSLRGIDKKDPVLHICRHSISTVLNLQGSLMAAPGALNLRHLGEQERGGQEKIATVVSDSLVQMLENQIKEKDPALVSWLLDVHRQVETLLRCEVNLRHYLRGEKLADDAALNFKGSGFIFGLPLLWPSIIEHRREIEQCLWNAGTCDYRNLLQRWKVKHLLMVAACGQCVKKLSALIRLCEDNLAIPQVKLTRRESNGKEVWRVSVNERSVELKKAEAEAVRKLCTHGVVDTPANYLTNFRKLFEEPFDARDYLWTAEATTTPPPYYKLHVAPNLIAYYSEDIDRPARSKRFTETEDTVNRNLHSIEELEGLVDDVEDLA